jgi:site-specific DNA-methyltransferase (adenine-specific)
MNKIIQGDCLEVVKDIPDNSIDMVLTSPPYDNLRTYNGSLDWGEHIWEPIIQELFRVIKDGGVVVWVVGDATIKGSETGTSFKQALYAKEIGFNIHDTMIWEKTSVFAYDPRNKRYKSAFEYMFIWSKGFPKTYNPIIDKEVKSAGKVLKGNRGRDKNGNKRVGNNFIANALQARFNIWTYSGNDGTKNPHPAYFPKKLVNDHIISWSNEGDTILDPFAGSGTVGKVAQELNRNYILIEKEAEYIKIAEARINAWEKEKQKKLV